MLQHDIRLIALDLDGTLLTSAKQLPRVGGPLLARVAQTGVFVVLITTRRYASTVNFYRELGLQTPFVCGNGAQVWAAPDGPLWAEHCIAQDAAHAIAQLADEHNWELGLTYGDMSYWRQRPNQPLGLHAPDITIVANNCDGVVGAPLRVLTWHPQAIDTIDAFCRTTLRADCSVERYVNAAGEAQSLGIFAPLANKGVALTLVMERLGVARGEVVTVGDNFNDLPMFACGAVSVAMANAPEAVRQQATLVAPSNDDEGIAWLLQHLALI
jgi:5-amino-6-(5-phospho-D-ribitylamino)uracil phosphatase